MRSSVMTTWKERWIFLGSALRCYQDLGMPLPTPPAMAVKVADWLPFDRMDRVVELGSGTGALTMAILKRLKPGARMVCVEKNPSFCDFLRQRINGAPVDIVNAAAEKLGAVRPDLVEAPADCVILSLPSSMVSEEVRQAWLDLTHGLLRPGGVVVTHQFRPKIRESMDTGRWTRDRSRWFFSLPPFLFETYRKI